MDPQAYQATGGNERRPSRSSALAFAAAAPESPGPETSRRRSRLDLGSKRSDLDNRTGCWHHANRPAAGRRNPAASERSSAGKDGCHHPRRERQSPLLAWALRKSRRIPANDRNHARLAPARISTADRMASKRPRAASRDPSQLNSLANRREKEAVEAIEACGPVPPKVKRDI